ncbi:hypothetical protein MMC09_005436 [Bachmanniomyces sp. S44760]|nr:hypothetical protein [Bachmanniomyces sp. S44760]
MASKGPFHSIKQLFQVLAKPFCPIVGHQDEVFEAFLDIAGVISLEKPKALSSEALRVANYIQTSGTQWGISYGPKTDGSFVPEQPGQLLLQAASDKSVKVTVLHTTLPSASDTYIDYIAKGLYPPPSSTTKDYTTNLERTALTIGELCSACNPNYLARALHNETYNYFFSQSPAIHTADIVYTIYDGSNPIVPVNTSIAIPMQKYLTSFAVTGKPAADGNAQFELYGAGGSVLNLGPPAIKMLNNPLNIERCVWWQKGLNL